MNTWSFLTRPASNLLSQISTTMSSIPDHVNCVDWALSGYLSRIVVCSLPDVSVKLSLFEFVNK